MGDSQPTVIQKLNVVYNIIPIKKLCKCIKMLKNYFWAQLNSLPLTVEIWLFLLCYVSSQGRSSNNLYMKNTNGLASIELGANYTAFETMTQWLSSARNSNLCLFLSNDIFYFIFLKKQTVGFTYRDLNHQNMFNLKTCKRMRVCITFFNI